MDEQKQKTDRPEVAPDPWAVQRKARWKLAAVAATVLMCSILMLYLVVDEPSQAELTIYAHARANKISALQYPEGLVELLENNGETEQFVLNYPFREEDPEIDLSAVDLKKGVPLFMQWDERWGYLEYGDDMVALNGCGPMCLAMAGYYVTGNAAFYPDRIVEFALANNFYAEGNGSKWTLISVGGPALGLDVKELPLVESKVAAYLQAGHPVIAVMGPGDFTSTGHFIVLTGYREGMVTVNDPNSYVNSGKAWNFAEIQDQIRNLWVVKAGTAG